MILGLVRESGSACVNEPFDLLTGGFAGSCGQESHGNLPTSRASDGGHATHRFREKVESSGNFRSVHMDPQLFADIDASVGRECETADRQIARPCDADRRLPAVHRAIDVRDRRAEVVVHTQKPAFFLGRNVPDVSVAMIHGDDSIRRIRVVPRHPEQSETDKTARLRTAPERSPDQIGSVRYSAEP